MASLDIYEPLLESCAETGTIDYTQWPSLLPPLVERLSYIAYHDFPKPRPYPILHHVLPSQHASDPLPDRFIEHPPVLPSNTPTTPRSLPQVPLFPGSSVSRVPDSQAENTEETQDDDEEKAEQLPAEVLQLLEQCLKTLRTCFTQKPPHTVQRLSELVLHPTKHYRSLPAWLRALDRVVSVSSGADIFPLSDVPPNIGLANGVLNGTDIGGILFANSANETRSGYDRESLGSDESLGGALLTPIPWLKDSDLSSSSGSGMETASSNSKVESWQDTSESLDQDADMVPLVDENGQTSTSMAETAAHAEAIAAVAQNNKDNTLAPGRSDGAVTQGELIRMEQEAGIVPVGHEDVSRIGNEDTELDLEDEGDNIPHARGPDVVGTVDMGKVEGEERQVRITSPPEESMSQVDANDAQEVLSGGVVGNKADSSGGSGDEFVKIEKDEADESKRSDDGDIVLVDADGSTEDASVGKKADESGVNVGADAADTTGQ